MKKTTNQNEWYLGIDLGTGSCKSLVTNRQAQVLGFGASEYTSSSTKQKWNEQDPDAMLDGLIRSVRTAIEKAGVKPDTCAALSIGSALHSLIALDRAGQPLTGIITWADGRSAPQAQAVRDGPDGNHLYQQTGCPPHSMYPLYKISWLRQEQPDIFARTARFVSVKEYALAHLTGEYLVDYPTAAGSGMLNTFSLDWDSDALALVRISTNQLSPLCNPRQIISGLRPEIAGEMGISPLTPIIIGASDATNSSIGAGAVLPGDATCMIGTSGALRRIASSPVLDPYKRTWCYAIDQNHWLIGGAINNGGIALSWLRDLFNQAFPALPTGQYLTFENLVALAENAGAGAGGLICLPFFAGERSPNWNLNAKAAFIGLDLTHSAPQVARAVLEGVAFRIRSVYDALLESSGPIQSVRASGGYTYSPLWMRIVSSVLNHELQTTTWGETSSLGAAMWALIGGGVLDSIEEAGALSPVAASCAPDVEDSRLYESLYAVYQRLYDVISPEFGRLNEFKRGIKMEKTV